LHQAAQNVLPQKKQLSSEVGKMIMQTIKASVVKFVKDEDGLTIVEYAVAGGLVTIAVVAAFTALGGAVDTRIRALCTAVGGTCAAATPPAGS
jgi:pilus assembly protein Flp/PilA